MKRYNVLFKIIVLAMVVGLLGVAGAMAEDKTITGRVQQSDSGLIVVATDSGEQFQVEGQDLSEMIGKVVKVTGNLSEEGEPKVIQAISVELIQSGAPMGN